MKKKILFVINTLGKAGAETAMIELMNRMDPQLYECSLFVLTGQGEMIHSVPDYINLLNTDYSDCSVLSEEGRSVLKKTVLHLALRRGNIVRHLPYLIKNAAAMLQKGRIFPEKLLWRVLSDGAQRTEEEYDLAVAYLEGGATYYVADHVKAKKKAAFIHIDYGQAGYTRALDKECYLSYDSIFTVSQEVKDAFLKIYPECMDKTDIFHNLLNVDRIVCRSKEPGGFEDSFDGIRLLTVGRLTAQKAYEIAIDAMKLLKDAGYPLRWYVLGEGNQRELLEKKIAALGLEKDFILVGAVDNPYPYYSQCDIYVHATRFEGKSIAIQEAQILRCAILASDCSGNREQITDGVDGHLCGLSAEAIKEGIIEMIAHPDTRERYAAAAQDKILHQKEDLEKLLVLVK